jgi:hypothetical protein
MTKDEIRKFLIDEFPEYNTDASIEALQSATPTQAAPTTLDELRQKATVFGRDGKLMVAQDYKDYRREYFSIHAFEEDCGEASSKKIYALKKAADEAKELASLRSELKNVRIVSVQGERLDVKLLSLPALRQHAADIANHKRMKGLSAGDLRAEYIAKHPTPERRADGYPSLPKSMCLPAGLRIGDRVADGIHAVEMTPELLHSFSRAKSDSNEWHFYRFRLVRAYGAGQVTERQQISTPTGAGEQQ